MSGQGGLVRLLWGGLLTEIQKIKNLLLCITVLLAFGAVYFARDMFLPIMIGLILALTLSPIVRWLARIGIPEGISAIVLIFGTGIALGAGGYLSSGPLSEVLSEAPKLGIELREKLSGVMASLDMVQSASEQVEQMATGGDAATTVALQQPGLLAFAAGSFANFLGLAAVGLVLALLILASGDLFYVKLVEALPNFSDKRRAVETVRNIERQISRYFLTITVINAGLGLCIGLAVMLVGMPSPLLWAVLGFTLNFLPFVGAIIGTALVAAIGILTFDTVGQGLLPAIVYFGLTMMEGNLITPAVLGRRLEMNTVSVFLTVIVWTWLWNVPGALMAVPFLVLLKVISDSVPGMRVFGSFLGVRTST